MLLALLLAAALPAHAAPQTLDLELNWAGTYFTRRLSVEPGAPAKFDGPVSGPGGKDSRLVGGSAALTPAPEGGYRLALNYNAGGGDRWVRVETTVAVPSHDPVTVLDCAGFRLRVIAVGLKRSAAAVDDNVGFVASRGKQTACGVTFEKGAKARVSVPYERQTMNVEASTGEPVTGIKTSYRLALTPVGSEGWTEDVSVLAPPGPHNKDELTPNQKWQVRLAPPLQ